MAVVLDNRRKGTIMSALRLNNVVLGGNLTRDPVLRKLASGSSVAEFGLAINESYTSKDGTKVEQTCFVDVVAWDKRAESAHAYLHKGDSLIVEGRLAYDAWQNDKGEKRNRLRVNARQLHFVGGRRRDTEAPEAVAGAPEPVDTGAEHDSGLPF